MLTRGKVILFYPPYDGPPLGAPLCLLALASTLRQANFEVVVIDAAIDPEYLTHIECESVDALCLGISVLTGPMIRGAVEVATAIKSNLRWLPIIFGGWHPTLVPDETLSEPYVDVVVRGQGEVMQSAFQSLGLGFVVAVLLVFSLMAVLFQSWTDPLIIMGAVPGAVAGILWMLVLTHTTLNIQSLLGSIMAVGIAVANSILVVSFANDQRIERGMSAAEAALEAGKERLRPVLMTAGAMLLGMLPMAIGSGEGGEQNAPLGRAVIGGLAVATVVTLCVVPVIYAILARGMPGRYVVERRFEAEAQGQEYHGPE